MKSRSVIVIGAGIGGITAAIHLARAGLHVTVLEKNARPGGRCDRLSRENFEHIQELGLPANPSLYIHAPARLDPAMAPTGQDSLIAIVPVGHMRESGTQNWNELRDQARQQVFRRLRTLGITDLEAHIKFEETYTLPAWHKRYNLLKGSTHGLSHRLTQMAYFRPANRHARYHNLYFVGASTHPGTGMPTAMVSGQLVSRRIMDDLSFSMP